MGGLFDVVDRETHQVVLMLAVPVLTEIVSEVGSEVGVPRPPEVEKVDEPPVAGESVGRVGWWVPCDWRAVEGVDLLA